MLETAGARLNQSSSGTGKDVNGQRDFPVGGQLISLLADT